MRKIIFINLSAACVIAIFLIAGMIPGSTRAVSAQKRDAMDERVQRLEDREEIRQLLMDYGRHLDGRDFLAFSQLFAEKDGEWIGGMGKAKGSPSIRKLMEETIGKDMGKPGPPNYHLFTNETIHLSGDRAFATAKWVFIVQGDAARPQPLYLGHYEDSLIRENGRWKFLRRTVHADIPTDNAISK
jgi:ketosteroid isomerase-like protein